jgi:DNA-binding response OmpR family regulator
VTSHPGQGTTFTIALPAADGDQQSAPVPVAETPMRPPRFETLLICDDEDDVRGLLVDVMRVRSYQVLEASGARQAIEIASGRNHAIDLLITDLVMPEMSGTELASELRKHNPSLQVLYISGYANDEAMLTVPLGQSSHFLAKPFLPGELVRTVNAILSRSADAEPEPPVEAQPAHTTT